MAFSQQDIDALDEAIASGELTVKINGREITYRHIDDLLKAKRHLQRSIATSEERRRRRRGLGGIVTVGDRGIR